MDATAIVRTCRQRSALSIRALADAAGVAASTVHRIEQGRLDPTTDVLTRIVEAAGLRLRVELLADSATSVAGLAQCIAADLAASPEDTSTPIRRIAELVARFNAADAARQRRMLAARPVSTGDGRWDAALAAVAEWLAVRAELNPPAWVHESNRYLEPSWWVTTAPSLRAWEYAGSPMAFKQHGVYLHRDSLVNV